ncbi:unnamed protein product [Oikopleura dioica]|uniref:Uncharacterized protein n=1 Tax=Oikopleura dioica TaxID=34765 RepID=E4YSU9_OIKDI|nr:unnamed protein product [Oikopleura dioica]
MTGSRSASPPKTYSHFCDKNFVKFNLTINWSFYPQGLKIIGNFINFKFQYFSSFKSGSIPRQVGGNRQVIYDRGARQEELRQAMGTEYETADLEGVDGHLYKGRVRKLPNLVRKTLDEEDLNRSLDSPAPADVHTPPTAPEKS